MRLKKVFSRYSSVDMPFIPIVLWVILICIPFFIGCHQESKVQPNVPPEVSVIEIVPGDMPVVFTFVGQTHSSHQVEIRARINGFLNKRVYSEGAMVKAGQVLFEMDPKPFRVQLDQAEAALAKQQAALEVAQANLARVKPLTELDALSRKDLDDATSRAQSAAAEVEQAKAQVESARLNLSYCTITSPIDGITSAALQQEGAYISAQDNQLTTVMVLSPIWVNFSVSENEMQNFHAAVGKGLLKPPAPDRYETEIILVDGTVYPYTGWVTFADPMYDEKSGTFLNRASIPNPDGVLRPNQYVRVRLKGVIRPAAIQVPQQAVQMGTKGHFVWVVNPDDKVDPRPVEVGEWHGSNWFINDGLRAGERVVVEGGLGLLPRMKVKAQIYKEKPVTEDRG
ncbi:MAG: efflux RND transporter periplasmic adaptor subunit [Deltaproteobacteria bacterium]|nr:efflux RND transporter periplasmic adaptor subunit [Deltaproteobacteria bacterium]